ncbi:hypothetical protein DL96DRAFT_245333 [Flagelloscypha sp. PMI_526]|nr:hypothetical protein DL96DRAFT_245333 [Flagelloscypha sp. PMI_526]
MAFGNGMPSRLLAIMGGILHLTGDQLVNELLWIFNEVFLGDSDEKQRTTKFEEAVKQLIEKYPDGKSGFPERRMRDINDACKTVVCASLSHNSAHPYLFRSYPVRSNQTSNCLLWQATRATTALLGLFGEIHIREGFAQQIFSSAEIRWNNPMNELIQESSKAFKPSEPSITCIVSIGSGHPRHLSMLDDKKDIFRRMALDCEQVADHMERRFTNQPDFYQRLNVQQGLQGLDMGDITNVSQIISHTRAYLEEARTLRDIDLVVENLLSRQPRVPVNSISDVLPSGYANESRDAILQVEKLASKPTKEELGSGYQNTLADIDAQARDHSAHGRHHDALRLRDEALTLRKHRLGPKHPDTLSTMHDFAMTLSELGSHETALQMIKQVLKLRKEKLGLNHPDTLVSKHALASSYASLGRHQDALRMRDEVLTLRKRILGPDHPETLWTMHDFASSLFDLGSHKTALQMSEHVYALRKEKIGPEHPETLASMQMLANTYARLGQGDDALRLRKEILALRKRVLGAEHQDTISVLQDFAMSLSERGSHETALQMVKQVLELRKEKVGPEHPDTLASMHALASIYACLGQHKEALALRDEVLTLRKRILGPNHPDTLSTMHDFATSLSDLGSHKVALQIGKQVLKLRKENLGSEHPDTLASRNNLDVIQGRRRS